MIGEPPKYTAFEESVARVFRLEERRDILSLLRQGGWRTPTQRRDAVKLAQFWARHQNNIGTDYGLAIRFIQAFDKGRDAASAFCKELLEEEYAEGLAAIDNLEDTP